MFWLRLKGSTLRDERPKENAVAMNEKLLDHFLTVVKAQWFCFVEMF